MGDHVLKGKGRSPDCASDGGYAFRVEECKHPGLVEGPQGWTPPTHGVYGPKDWRPMFGRLWSPKEHAILQGLEVQGIKGMDASKASTMVFKVVSLTFNSYMKGMTTGWLLAVGLFGLVRLIQWILA